MGITPITKGAYVSPQTIITSLRKLSQLKLEFTVPEKYGSTMKSGNTVQFTIENNPQFYKAKIKEAFKIVDQENKGIVDKR